MSENNEKKASKIKRIRKMTKERLQNIALYYLERFDSSSSNLYQVLKRRIYNYQRNDENFNISEAELWINDIITKFEKLGYLNDARYAEFKVQNYINAGKPERYIRQKLQAKGIDEQVLDEVLQNQEFDEEEMAKKFVAKKKIGPYRKDETKRKEYWQKDVSAVIRAGFSYEIAKKIIGVENIDDFS
ncbi:MAG: regulatory protein RecX [Alphaproteobacteria bacterium]|nr:regulatory protein RecX [Alphaproteobacteria bacterium]